MRKGIGTAEENRERKREEEKPLRVTTYQERGGWGNESRGKFFGDKN